MQFALTPLPLFFAFALPPGPVHAMSVIIAISGTLSGVSILAFLALYVRLYRRRAEYQSLAT